MSQAYLTIDDWEMVSPAFEQFADVVTQLRSVEARQLEHGQAEQRLEKEGRELLRRLLQGHLDDRAAHETDWESLEGADGISRSQRRQGCESHLETLFGAVIVTRRAYRAPGAPSLFALEAALNVPPDKYSDGLRRRLGQEVAIMSFDEATERIAPTTGGHLPKRQSEEVAVKIAQDFEVTVQVVKT